MSVLHLTNVLCIFSPIRLLDYPCKLQNCVVVETVKKRKLLETMAQVALFVSVIRRASVTLLLRWKIDHQLVIQSLLNMKFTFCTSEQLP